MEIFYFAIICILFIFAVIDLNVGVSNDAVNFLNSAVGAKAASLKTILIVAALGIFIGASTSNGMMDIARHGMFQPEHFNFRQLMCVFLAVTVTDVVLLDIFNSLGMPTSTTVSMVFELLGASFVISLVKLSTEDMPGVETMADLLNTGKALEVIAGIFLSVAIAFFFGIVVQWIARLIFTYNYKKGLTSKIGIFGGVAITSILYFMVFKGMKGASFMTPDVKAFLNENTWMLVGIIFVVSTVLMQFLHAIKVNVFKVVIMVGTFALALAFAGNDLVNFIGVTMAALDSFLHFRDALGTGATPDTFMMGFLNDSATTSVWFLVGAGAVMVWALCTSKKAHEVLKTSINLSRQDEGDEMFGSSSMARKLVRAGMGFINGINNISPSSVKKWVNSRFNQDEVTIDEGAAFDLVRASVNLVLAGLLIALGTSLKLPLSTTYVTFMVGMGSSLADRAWGRETAVFRITGVISVIGGWFLTAGAAFILAGIVAAIMYFGGSVAMIIMTCISAFLLVRSHLSYNKKAAKDAERDVKMDVVLTSENKDEVWENLKAHTAETLCHTIDYAADTYEGVITAFAKEDVRKLRSALGKIVEEKAWLKQMRRKETLGFRRIDKGLAFEKNTWYYLSSNNAQQILNTLTRITNPMKEHTDNNFRPLSPEYLAEFAPYQKRLIDVFRGISRVIRTGDYTDAEKLSSEGKWLKKEISNLRRLQTHRLQEDADNIKVAFVYLNLIQESHELLSEVRNVLRGCEKYFIDQKELSVEEASL